MTYPALLHIYRRLSYAWRSFTIAIAGLTHWRCNKCGRRKGPTRYQLCWQCQFANLESAMRCGRCGCSPFRELKPCLCYCHETIEGEPV
jgi:hypothetical protein